MSASCNLCRPCCAKSFQGSDIHEAGEFHVPVILKGNSEKGDLAVLARLQISSRQTYMAKWLADELKLHLTEMPPIGPIGNAAPRYRSSVSVAVPTSPGLFTSMDLVVMSGRVDADLTIGSDTVYSGFCVVLLPKAVCCLVRLGSASGLQEDADPRQDGHVEVGRLNHVRVVNNQQRRSPVINLTATRQAQAASLEADDAEVLDFSENGLGLMGRDLRFPGDAVHIHSFVRLPNGSREEWSLDGVVKNAKGPDAAGFVRFGIGLEESDDAVRFREWAGRAYLARMCLW